MVVVMLVMEVTNMNETIIKEIEKILKMNEEEIEIIGNNAREFVINNKSAEKQVEVINKFLKNNI